MPQDPGFPEHAGSDDPPSPVLEAKTESFLVSFFDPQWGQTVPSQ
jgi:hypothetical protein